MVERKPHRNKSITKASQEEISPESRKKIEGPIKSRKRAKTTHVKVESEQENELEERTLSPAKLLEGENLVTSHQAGDQVLLTDPASKPSKRKKRKIQVKAVTEEKVEVDDNKIELEVRQRNEIKEDEYVVEKGGQDAQSAPKKSRKKRKTKEEKEAEAMPLAARSVGVRILIGAHVSAAKGAFSVLARIGIDSWSISINSCIIIRTENPFFFRLGVHNAVSNCVHIG